MNLLKEQGHVVELHIPSGEGRRFDSKVTPHDHLICSICGTVVDIDVYVDHSLLLTEEQQNGFDVKEISINVYGLCPGCKNMENKNVVN